MILFDASAVLDLFRKGRAGELLQGCTIDLAGYELGNAVRRLVDVERSLTPGEGAEILAVLENTINSMARAKMPSLATILDNAI